MQVPILSGCYTDAAAEWRSTYPRNLIPVAKAQGISTGYLRPADGIVQSGTGPGTGRGGVNWNGTLYRVMGTKLVSIAEDGTCTTLGDVGTGGQCSFAVAFDRIAITSGGRLYYWNGSLLTQVTDPDLGVALDVRFSGGYYITTDGTSIVTTDLTDPMSVNPLHYGSSESDPDQVVGIDEMRDEIYAFNRYTIEVFDNVGGSGFPFQVIKGAQIPRGAVGTYGRAGFINTFAFLGSGRNEAPSVWLVVAGDTENLATREIDTLLATYTEDELASAVVEARVSQNQLLLYIHLPDRCLVYDRKGSQALQEKVWFTLDSGTADTPSTYRARNLVWCYDRWNVEDPTSSAFGYLTDETSDHYGQVVHWDFGTLAVYANGNDAIVHEMELVCLSGRVALGKDPVIWTSYSVDGETWSQERSVRAGKQGQRNKRIAWRECGAIKHWRVQRFRGTSEAFLSMVRLEMQVEQLFTRPGQGA